MTHVEKKINKPNFSEKESKINNDDEDRKNESTTKIIEIKKTIIEPLEMNETQNEQLQKMDVDDISETLQTDKIKVLEKDETMEQD